MYKGKIFKAVVLAGGSGLRMKSSVRKQYLKIQGVPLMAYSLRAFQESPADEIILVVKDGEQEFCRREIVENYGLDKVTKIVSGGKERYHSSFAGILAAEGADYVMIHDAARPCLTQEIILESMESVIREGGCTVGVPVNDTISIVGENRHVKETPDRNCLWSVQTPQSFRYEEIRKAHELLHDQEASMTETERKSVTDDVSVYRGFLGKEVYMAWGAYENIKVTTPSDLETAELLLTRLENKR